MNQIPFDLEKYNSGEYQVVYRNGEKCIAVYYIKEAVMLVSVDEGGNTRTHHLNGKHSCSPNYDLLLIVPDEIKKVFFNQYVNFYSETLFESLEGAIECATHDRIGTWECTLNLTTGELTGRLIRKEGK